MLDGDKKMLVYEGSNISDFRGLGWTKIMRVSFLYPIMLSRKVQKHAT